MADPVSWLVIRPGWKVYASDGAEVGEVDEIVGDEPRDIFDGLAIVTSALGKPRYVAAEQVGTITEGAVRLTISSDEAEALGEFLEPATSAIIMPDGKGGLGGAIAAEARKLEGEALAPIQRHERSRNIWRRFYRFFRRRTS
jgi:hypothetical protein